MLTYAKIIKRTMLEVGRVVLAKLGHDPYGMLHRDKPIGVVIALTYLTHHEHLRGSVRWGS